MHWPMWHRWEAVTNQLYLRAPKLIAQIVIDAPSVLGQISEDLRKGVGIGETRILYRCTRPDCTALKVTTIEGWWSMEDITGKKSQTEADTHGDTGNCG